VYDAIFGALSGPVHAKPAWILAAEAELFEAPLAAARVPGGGLLCERHSLRVVPSGHFLLGRHNPPAAGTLVAFGDPVYNRADPRARGFLNSPAPLELPRLPGGAVEIRAAAGAWGGAHLLLEGAAANRSALESAMAARPAVLHFATHFMTPARQPDRTNTILSLRRDGSLDVLTTADIGASSWSPGLVVLSGCSSGRGEIRAGAGLLGLSRAWIAAGAGAVVASLWPTPDSGGELFRWFYQRLREGDPPAEALRRAQIQAMQSGRPALKSWAAYVIHSRS
jgi:CHAT domain-containing protein